MFFYQLTQTDGQPQRSLQYILWQDHFNHFQLVAFSSFLPYLPSAFFTSVHHKSWKNLTTHTAPLGFPAKFKQAAGAMVQNHRDSGRVRTYKNILSTHFEPKGSNDINTDTLLFWKSKKRFQYGIVRTLRPSLWVQCAPWLNPIPDVISMLRVVTNPS